MIPNFNNLEVFSSFSPSSAATFSDVSPAFSNYCQRLALNSDVSPNYCQRLALNHSIPFDLSEYRVKNISEALADPNLQPAYINKVTKELFIPFDGESPIEHFKKLNSVNHPSAFSRINMISPKSHFGLNNGANKGNFGDYLEKRD